MRHIAEILEPQADTPMICDLSDELCHGVLVSNLAYRLAKELGMPDEFCYDMSVAGMLHDIGKLELWGYMHEGGESKLEIEEARYKRTHPTLSYLRVSKEGFNERICQSVLHHHENFDGSGYPDNLRGKEIPAGARILRVCDVFAALVSDRAYRAAFTTDAAMELLVDEVKNFDMFIFLAFQRVVGDPSFSEVTKIIEEYNKGYRKIRGVPEDADYHLLHQFDQKGEYDS